MSKWAHLSNCSDRRKENIILRVIDSMNMKDARFAALNAGEKLLSCQINQSCLDSSSKVYGSGVLRCSVCYTVCLDRLVRRKR